MKSLSKIFCIERRWKCWINAQSLLPIRDQKNVENICGLPNPNELSSKNLLLVSLRRRVEKMVRSRGPECHLLHKEKFSGNSPQCVCFNKITIKTTSLDMPIWMEKIPHGLSPRWSVRDVQWLLRVGKSVSSQDPKWSSQGIRTYKQWSVGCIYMYVCHTHIYVYMCINNKTDLINFRGQGDIGEFEGRKRDESDVNTVVM